MKSSLETVSTLERKLNIEVPAVEVQAAFERMFQGLQRRVVIKGFRKGKAPLTTVKAIYGERVKQDVAQDIIQANYVTALREHKLEPVSYPAIEFDPIEEAQPFQFTAEFEVRPEVKLRKIEGLQVKKEKLELTDKVVDDTLEDIRRSRSETVPVFEDRGAEAGDIAVIDFEGFADGQPLENGAAQGHTLELGSNTFIPGFEDGVIGMRPGATHSIRLAFPETYHVANLAGQPVEFKVTLKELKKKTLPELTDDFAKSVGPYENLEALKQAIRDDHKRRETHRIYEDLKNRMMRALVDANPVEVPKALLADQKKALIEDLKKRMKQQGMNDEQFVDQEQKWNLDFENTASYMIQSSFLIDKISSEHNIKATSADMDAKLKEYTAQTGIEFSRMVEFYGDADRKARLLYQITEEKVLDLLLSKAAIQEIHPEELAAELAKEETAQV